MLQAVGRLFNKNRYQFWDLLMCYISFFIFHTHYFISLLHAHFTDEQMRHSLKLLSKVMQVSDGLKFRSKQPGSRDLISKHYIKQKNLLNWAHDLGWPVGSSVWGQWVGLSSEDWPHRLHFCSSPCPLCLLRQAWAGVALRHCGSSALVALDQLEHIMS